LDSLLALSPFDQLELGAPASQALQRKSGAPGVNCGDEAGAPHEGVSMFGAKRPFDSKPQTNKTMEERQRKRISPDLLLEHIMTGFIISSKQPCWG